VPGQNATIGGTGMPVAIQMSLQFQETSYLTKNAPGDGKSSSDMQLMMKRTVNQNDTDSPI
jgi:hypothetical protein